MREIKFKLYDNETKEFMWIVDLFNKETITIQYTWFKDKNWKDIYEWDIVRRHFEYPNEKQVIIQDLFDVLRLELDESKCEVIWNIYENPELLNLNK